MVINMRTYLINLDSRPDRLEESKKELNNIGLNYERFKAIYNSNPIIGCAMSHFNILELNKNSDENILILEDDIHFIVEFPIVILNMALDDLSNKKWDMLYLGGNICGKMKQVSENVAKLSHAQSTHAYVVNSKFISTLLEYKCYIGKHLDLIYANDVIPYHNCYITVPMLAVQRPSFSDIENRMVDYSIWMQERYWSNMDGNS